MEETKKLVQLINSLIQVESNKTDEEKIQNYQLAKEVVLQATKAKQEFKNLSENDKDSMAFSIGLEFVRVLGA